MNFVYGQKFTLSQYSFELFAFFIDTSNNVRLYYNTFTALGFNKKGNGIKLEGF